jgi:murein DD-endopeptidase MepM/ murein hydrolase activator NlpD
LLAQDIVIPEFEKVSAVWSQRTPTLYWTAVFSPPISSEYPTTSPYGTRRSYNGGPYASYHEGQDFGVAAGVPVHAPGAGVVALAEQLNVRGNAVILDHGGGVYSGYWHLSEIHVTVGQAVALGDIVGLSGNTGLSTGAHLHWELRIYGIAVDPMQFVGVPLLAPQ